MAMNIYENIKEYDEEIIEYGMDMFKTMVIGVICSVIIAFIFGELQKGCAFVLLLLPLRQNAGGLHMKTRGRCAVVSAAIYVAVLLVFKYICIAKEAQVILYLCLSVVLVMMAPVQNSERLLNKEELKVYGKRSRLILEIETVIFMGLIVMHNEQWAMVLLCVLIVADFLIITGKIKNIFKGV